jgi:predicted histidine transporter YuiF (NhaC family)
MYTKAVVKEISSETNYSYVTVIVIIVISGLCVSAIDGLYAGLGIEDWLCVINDGFKGILEAAVSISCFNC